MSPISVAIATLAILLFGGGIIIVIYLITERNKNASKAENHTWVQIIPKAGMERNYRQPNELIGGVACIKVPDVNGQVNEYSPTHVLGEAGEFPAMYPPGKMKFVQCPMQKIIYYEGDMEPLSNVDNIPIVSGQLMSNILNGSNTAAVDVIQRSQQESGGHKPVDKKAIFMYIMLGGALIAAVIAAVMAAKAAGIKPDIDALSNLIKQALGLK